MFKLSKENRQTPNYFLNRQHLASNRNYDVWRAPVTSKGGGGGGGERLLMKHGLFPLNAMFALDTVQGIRKGKDATKKKLLHIRLLTRDLALLSQGTTKAERRRRRPGRAGGYDSLTSGNFSGGKQTFGQDTSFRVPQFRTEAPAGTG